MRTVTAIASALFVCTAVALMGEAGGDDQPYKVLKRVKAGGEGSWDYVYADAAARRLYIPRRRSSKDATQASVAERLEVFDLDSLEPVGRIDGVGGHGAVVDPSSGHGFTSSKPISMFDARTLKAIRTIETGDASPDGILFDPFNQRVYVLSHPTRSAIVVDSRDGTVVGTIDLGGTPEQAVTDGKGTLYVVMQDQPGSITRVDARTMKATAHYALGSHGSCNGLALDVRNGLLFAACARADNADAFTMLVLRADTGAIVTRLPLAGASDGAAFNSSTMEVFSTGGNGTLTVIKEKDPVTFQVEQNLATMEGARTITLDTKTNRLFTIADERVPSTGTPPADTRPRGTAVPGSFTILMIGRN
jgi:DNA-binding beta-propeller fold protein YncE